jgi:hypothetical protein
MHRVGCPAAVGNSLSPHDSPLKAHLPAANEDLSTRLEQTKIGNSCNRRETRRVAGIWVQQENNTSLMNTETESR